MSRSFLVLIAGPSRLCAVPHTVRLRELHYSARAFAKSPSSSARPQPQAPRPPIRRPPPSSLKASTTPLKADSINLESAAVHSPTLLAAQSATTPTHIPSNSSARAPLWAKELEGWEWQPMQSAKKGYIAEKRILFQRPSRFSLYTSFLFPGVAALVASVVYGLYMYKTYSMPDSEYEDFIKNEPWFSKINRDIVILLYPVGIAFAIYITISAGRSQISRVHQLTQIRLTPSEPASTAQPTYLVRMQHGGHEIAPMPLRRGRDIPQDSIKLYHVSPSTLRLDIDRPSLRAKWNKKYFLDFGHTPDLDTTLEPVVLSRQRLENVFGRIDDVPAEMLKAEGKEGFITEWLDRVTGVKKQNA